MIKDKVVVLSGDNKEFNNRFLKRFYDKVKEVKLLTSNIFDKSYDEYEKITLVSNVENLNKALQNSDLLIHFVHDELSSLKNPTLHDEFTFSSEKLLQSAVNTKLPKVVFVSDGSTKIANDKMIKNIAIKYAFKSKSTSVNYVLVQDSSTDELIDSTLFALKTMSSGEVFVKKYQEQITFSSRLKDLFFSKSKIEKYRESFFTSEELSRMIDYGKYYKIAVDEGNYKLNIFADRLKSLKTTEEELERA